MNENVKKTAAEILTEFGCPDVPFDENVTMYYPAILSAMEEYKNLSTPPQSVRTETAEEIFNEYVVNGVKATLRKNVINAMEIYASQLHPVYEKKEVTDERIEKMADAYMFTIGCVDKKEFIRHDYTQGLKAMRVEYASQLHPTQESKEVAESKITDKEYKDLNKALYPKDNSKKFTR